MKTTFCPKCSTYLILTDNLENSKRIKCSNCKITFENPHFKSMSIQKRIESNFFVIGFTIIVACIVLWMAGGHSISWLFTPSTTNTATQQKIQNSPWDASVYQVENYLKRNYLKDPDSYQSIEWGKVVELNSDKYVVRHKYRARNSYGGYVVEEKLFVLDAEGNIIDTKDVR